MSMSAWAMMAVLWFFIHFCVLILVLVLFIMFLVVGVGWYDFREKYSSEKSQHN